MLLVMTSYTTACILPDSNVNDYNFTVYSVTNGIDDTTYNGSIATELNPLICYLCGIIFNHQN